MDSRRLSDDQPTFDQFSYLLMGVCIGDFIGLIGVQPELLFATVEVPGGKPLLKPEHTHGCGRSAEREICAILIIMCLGVALLGFIFLGALCASWIWISVSFPRSGQFSAIISPIKFFPLSLSPLLPGPL
uniref:Uncharacterized protein n=3 Tax=Canis lupus TaxID=9612 RepID=A0A8C0MKS7_CANLF